jgi:hypothetical protein
VGTVVVVIKNKKSQKKLETRVQDHNHNFIFIVSLTLFFLPLFPFKHGFVLLYMGNALMKGEKLLLNCVCNVLGFVYHFDF